MAEASSVSRFETGVKTGSFAALSSQHRHFETRIVEFKPEQCAVLGESFVSLLPHLLPKKSPKRPENMPEEVWKTVDDDPGGGHQRIPAFVCLTGLPT